MLELVKQKTKDIIGARKIRDSDRLEMLEILYTTFYRALDNSPIPNTTSIPTFRDVRDLLETSLRIASSDKRKCLIDSDVYDLNILLTDAEKQTKKTRSQDVHAETQTIDENK